MEKAKPCPFCGSEIRITKGVYNAPFWFFKCTNRQCRAVISFDNDKANICPDVAIYNYNARRSEMADYIRRDNSAADKDRIDRCNGCEYAIICPDCGQKIDWNE